MVTNINKWFQILANVNKYYQMLTKIKQAGAELGQAQLKLELELRYT